MTEDDDDLEFFNKMANKPEPTIYEEASNWLFLHYFHSSGKSRDMFKYMMEAIGEKETLRRDNDVRNS